MKTRRVLLDRVRLGARTLLPAMLLCAWHVQARAQWGPSPLPVSTAAGDQEVPQTISDGQGGAIVVWRDSRPGQPVSLYAQRISQSGVPLWNANGIPVSGTSWDLSFSVLADGEGGVIVASRPGEGIVTQRLGPDGVTLWPAGGVLVPAQPRYSMRPALASDGSGGVIVAWMDARGGCDIYANRVSGNGTLAWPSEGLALRQGVCDSFWLSLDEQPISAIPDGAGGAIVSWTDYRQTASDIRAQRINGAGAIQWAQGGVVVCDVAYEVKISPIMATDGAGGAIVVWRDTRVYQFHDFAQRIDADGQRQWATDGVLLDPSFYGKSDHDIISDRAGGAFVRWLAGTPGGSVFHRVQRLSESGEGLWGSSGVILSGPADFEGGGLVEDPNGGVICTWLEPLGQSYVLDAQRLDANGNPQWGIEGALVGGPVEPGPYSPNPYAPNPGASDGAGGLITVWEQQASSGRDLYAQHVTSTSPVVSVGAPSLASSLLLSLSPNPCHDVLFLSVASDRARAARLAVYDLQGRMVRDFGSRNLVAGRQTILLAARNGSPPLESGIYFAQLTTNGASRRARFVVVR